MHRFSVRQLVEKDIEFAYEMTVREGWNDRRNDVKRMFSYEPNGGFIAEVEGSPVGNVFTVSYGRLGWIGLLIVKAEHRKKGVGTLLMKKAIDYLLRCGVETIKLEAVPEISDLYRKLGFIDEFDSLRFKGISREPVSKQADSTTAIKKEEITKIGGFDAEYFGADRTRVLTCLYEENPKLCFACYQGSDVAGYIMCRKALNGYKLGPFVCNSEDTLAARDLLARCIGKLGSNKAVYAGVPAANKEAVRILGKFGFEQYSKSIRMRLGKDSETEKVSGIFAIGDPMKG